MMFVMTITDEDLVRISAADFEDLWQGLAAVLRARAEVIASTKVDTSGDGGSTS